MTITLDTLPLQGTPEVYGFTKVCGSVGCTVVGGSSQKKE